MNKKYVNIALVSLLFCTVHNSNGMSDDEASGAYEDYSSDSSEASGYSSDSSVKAKSDSSELTHPNLNRPPKFNAKPKRVRFEDQRSNSREISRYTKNLAIAAGIKIATHLATKSILKDSAMGSILGKTAKINALARVFLVKEKSLKYYAENAGSYLTSVAVVATEHNLSKTSIGKKVEKLFNGRFNPIKKPCKYLIEGLLTSFLWIKISNLNLLRRFIVK